MELYQTSHAREDVEKQKETNGSALLYYLKQGPITNLKSYPSKVCRDWNLRLLFWQAFRWNNIKFSLYILLSTCIHRKKFGGKTWPDFVRLKFLGFIGHGLSFSVCGREIISVFSFFQQDIWKYNLLDPHFFTQARASPPTWVQHHQAWCSNNLITITIMLANSLVDSICTRNCTVTVESC